MNSIGNKIKEIRLSKKFTQNDLADGIANRSYISQIEKGIAQPSYKLLNKICERLECNIEDIIENDNFVKLDLKKLLTSMENLIESGNYILANEDYLDIIKQDQKSFTSTEFSTFYFCEGVLREKIDSNLRASIESFKKSYSYFKTFDSMDLKIKTINKLVSSLLRENSISEAFNYIDEAYDYLISHKINGIEKIKLMINLGIAHSKSNENYSAIRFLNQAIKISFQSGIFLETGKAFMVLGLCERKLGNYQNSIIAYEKAMQFFISTEDDLNLAGTYTNLGILKRFEKLYQESFSYFNKANNLYLELSDTQGLGNILYELALNHYELKDYLNISKKFEEYLSNSFNDSLPNIYIKFQSLLAATYIQDSRLNEGITIYLNLLKSNGNIKINGKTIFELLSDIYIDNNMFLELKTLWETYSK